MKVKKDDFIFYKNGNWIDLSKLPKKTIKNNKNIDWANCLNYTVEYFFEGENGYIKILDTYRKKQ